MKNTANFILCVLAVALLFIHCWVLVSYLQGESMQILYFEVYILFFGSVVFFMALLNAVFRRNFRPYLRFIPLFLLFSYLSGIGVMWFIWVDSNKVSLCVKNMSGNEMTDVNIVARNQQHIKISAILPDSSKTVVLDCSAVTFDDADTVGLAVYYKSGKRTVRLLVAGPDSGLSPYIEIRVINDTIAFESKIYADTTWYKFKDGKEYLPWSKVIETLPRE